MLPPASPCEVFSQHTSSGKSQQVVVMRGGLAFHLFLNVCFLESRNHLLHPQRMTAFRPFSISSWTSARFGAVLSASANSMSRLAQHAWALLGSSGIIPLTN